MFNLGGNVTREDVLKSRQEGELQDNWKERAERRKAKNEEREKYTKKQKEQRGQLFQGASEKEERLNQMKDAENRRKREEEEAELRKKRYVFVCFLFVYIFLFLLFFGDWLSLFLTIFLLHLKRELYGDAELGIGGIDEDVGARGRKHKIVFDSDESDEDYMVFNTTNIYKLTCSFKQITLF